MEEASLTAAPEARLGTHVKVLAIADMDYTVYMPTGTRLVETLLDSCTRN